MEKRDFIATLMELIQNEDIISVNRDVDDLRQKFEDYLIEATRQFQIAEMEAEEKGEQFDEVEWMPGLREEFFGIYNAYKEKANALRKKVRDAEEENLRKKRALINQFKELIADEENIGAAFATHKEINEKWKEIGDIPRTKRHAIQQEFSALQEEFFYNINIYKDIKEYDFKKNFEAKEEIINQLKELLKSDDLSQLEAQIKVLQNKWEDVGPTKQNLWEKIKDEYWSSLNAVYDKIHAFYEARREERKQNIVLKKDLIGELEKLIAEKRASVKDWNKHTDLVIALQKKWKEIGFGSKDENESVWKIFRKHCDTFFEEKSKFFETVHEEFDQIAEKKKELIQKVNDLKESTDWIPTSKAIIQLQKQWKKAGNAGRRYEQRLWREFRSACDFFFDAKEAHFAEKDKAFEENLKAKEELIKEIETFQLPEEKKEAIESLKTFAQRYAAIGLVPKKDKDNVFKAYKSALNKHYDALDLKGLEKEKIMFQARINMLKGSGDASRLLADEKKVIRNDINKVKQEIMQLENNLGFFSSSKGDNPLLKQVQQNIEKEKKKLEELMTKLKMVPNE